MWQRASATSNIAGTGAESRESFASEKEWDVGLMRKIKIRPEVFLEAAEIVTGDRLYYRYACNAIRLAAMRESGYATSYAHVEFFTEYMRPAKLPRRSTEDGWYGSALRYLKRASTSRTRENQRVIALLFAAAIAADTPESTN